MGSIEEKNLKIDENLRKIDSTVSRNLEKRVAHISEKAEIVDNIDNDEFREKYEWLFSDRENSCFVLDENKSYVSAVKRAIDMFDRLKCVECLSPEKVSSVLNNRPDTDFETDTVVYLKNSLADIAFNKFSKCLLDARVLYEESFAAVCEEVYYSRHPYCILPIENSEDGRLSGFGNMIRKYELKIVLTCNVESANGRVTKFALLKRDIANVDCADCFNEGDYLEIGFHFGEENKLGAVLEAANFFGYSLNKVDSLPIYYSEKEYYFDVVFEGKGEISRFLFWLELEVPRYEIIGIYKHIETNGRRTG